MALVFGNFLNRKHAEAFLEEVEHRFKTGGQVIEPRDIVTKEDETVHFDWEVHIWRKFKPEDFAADFQREREIEALVDSFGGEYFGT
jgi:hypothetical protein